MSGPRVTIVHLGRPQGLGERRRVEGWQLLLEGVDAIVTTIAVTVEHRRHLRPPRPSNLVTLLRRRAVIETLAWDEVGTARHLRATNPDAIIFVTARAYHPLLRGLAPVEVLDLVDRLSEAYRDRSSVVRAPLRRQGFHLLSWSHRGFESWARAQPMRRVCAGYADMSALAAMWLPIPIRSHRLLTPTEPDHDLLFFGNLSYPPNIAAVRRLARLWPAIRAKRPETTLLVAGTSPTYEVLHLSHHNGWTLLEDFDDVPTLCGRARLAIVPLCQAAGIQIKVLDAAAAGIAQLVSPLALRGFAPGFPAAVASDDPAFVDGIVEMLEDVSKRQSLSQAAQQHVETGYAAHSWHDSVVRLLAGTVGSSAESAPRVSVGTMRA